MLDKKTILSSNNDYVNSFQLILERLGLWDVPSTFHNSLSWYQALKYVLQYLIDKVIPGLTVNDEQIKQLYQYYQEVVDYCNDYFDNLDLQEEVNNKLDEMYESGQIPELITKLNNYSNSNKVDVGNNLLTNDTLWTTNNGWNGSYNLGFTHIVGHNEPLVYDYNFEANKQYILEFDVASPLPAGNQNASNDFSVKIGDTKPIVTYRGGGSMHYCIGLKPTVSGNLQFICCKASNPFESADTFNGTISNITLKETSGLLSQLNIYDNDHNIGLPMSIMLEENRTVAIGLYSGISNYNQTDNVYLGVNSGRYDTTGYYNTGIGANTLQQLVNGSRNTAIGKQALNGLISGDRNTAIGSFAMSGNKWGRQNIAMGFDTMMSLQQGNDNIALGNQALVGIVNASNQLAIGPQAMAGSTYSGTDQNIAIGRLAMYYLTEGSNNVGLGSMALYKNTTGSHNIAVGNSSLGKNTTGLNNVAVGSNALHDLTTGENNVACGFAALYYATEGNQNIGIGQTALYRVTTGVGNIGIGSSALSRITSSNNFIGIGNNAGNQITAGSFGILIGNNMSHNKLTNMEYSSAIGSTNLQNMTSLTRSIMLGNNIKTNEDKTVTNVIAINTGTQALEITQDNMIYLNRVLYIDIANQAQPMFGFGVSSPEATIDIKANSSSGKVPIKLRSGNVLTNPVDGGFEYDGSHLYFTIGSTRHQLI